MVLLSPLLIRKPSAVVGASRRWVRLSALSVYFFCIVVIVLMETIEVARLVRADLGVGLVPFVYVGCLIAISLQATDALWGRLRGWQVSGTLFWLLSFCITTVKAVAVGRFGTKGPLARKGSKYPVEDQLTDLIVLVIFYAILVAMQIILVYVKPARRVSGVIQDDEVELK